MNSGMKLMKDMWPAVKAGLARLPKQDVLVGIPNFAIGRDDNSPINNAEIGYIHEHGAPEANIPARPWLSTGIREAKEVIKSRFKQAAQLAIHGDVTGIEVQLNHCGAETVEIVKAKLASNIPPPLKPSTLAARRRRGVTRTNTLIDTANLQNHINYVVRGA